MNEQEKKDIRDALDYARDRATAPDAQGVLIAVYTEDDECVRRRIVVRGKITDKYLKNFATEFCSVTLGAEQGEHHA